MIGIRLSFLIAGVGLAVSLWGGPVAISGVGAAHPAGYVPVLLSNGRLATFVNERLSVPESYLTFTNTVVSNAVYWMERRLGEPNYRLTPQGCFELVVMREGRIVEPVRWTQTLDIDHAETRVHLVFDGGGALEGACFIAADENVIVLEAQTSGGLTAHFRWIPPTDERIVPCAGGFRTYGRRVVETAVEKAVVGDVTFFAFADSLEADAASPAARAKALAARCRVRGLAAMRAEHRRAWANFYAERTAHFPDQARESAARMCEYQLRCHVTEHSIPVGISPDAWHGKIFAFDEMYAVGGLLSAGHFAAAKVAVDYRFDTLREAHSYQGSAGFRNYRNGHSFGARWLWQTMGDNLIEGARAGFWLNHIFHMAAIAWSAEQYYRYTRDLDYYAARALPVIVECARYYRWHHLYDEKGAVYVGKCTDLERLGPARERAAMTTFGVMRTFLSAAEGAERIAKAGKTLPPEINSVTVEEIAEWRDFARRLEASVEVRNGLFSAYPGCPELSMGTLAGFFPFQLFPPDHPVARRTLETFLAHGQSVGNMYKEGRRVCPWYAATMSAAAGYAGLAEARDFWLGRALESRGLWGEFWEINEPGITQRRPWFMTAAGNVLYALMLQCSIFSVQVRRANLNTED